MPLAPSGGDCAAAGAQPLLRRRFFGAVTVAPTDGCDGGVRLQQSRLRRSLSEAAQQPDSGGSSGESGEQHRERRVRTLRIPPPAPPAAPPPPEQPPPRISVGFLPDLSAFLTDITSQSSVDTASVSADSPPYNFTLNPAFVAQSTLNFGRLQNPDTLRRLRSGFCLEVLSIGGSVSCGSTDAGPEVPDRPRGKEDAWPAHLEELLGRFPCVDELTGEPGRHRVENRCSRGVGTDFWVESIANLPLRLADPAKGEAPVRPSGGGERGEEEPGKYVLDLSLEKERRQRPPDIVLVDTVINDLSGLKTATRHHQAYWGFDEIITRYTETLILLLRGLRGSPSVVYVGTCSHARSASRGDPNAAFPADGASPPRAGDAAAQQALATRHHDVPHVSVVDGLGGPIPSGHAVDWFDRAFKADSHHPTRLGHRVVAAMVLNLLLVHNASAAHPRIPGAPGGSKCADVVTFSPVVNSSAPQ